jgi:hypothetical protein
LISRNTSNASNDNRCKCCIATWWIRTGLRMSEWSSEEARIYGPGCDRRWKRSADWMMAHAWELSSGGWCAIIDLCGLSLKKLWTREERKASGHPGFIGVGRQWYSSESRFEKLMLKSVFFWLILAGFHLSRYQTHLCKDSCLYQSKINSERIFQSRSSQLGSPVLGFAFCLAGSLIPCSPMMRKHWHYLWPINLKQSQIYKKVCRLIFSRVANIVAILDKLAELNHRWY